MPKFMFGKIQDQPTPRTACLPAGPAMSAVARDLLVSTTFGGKIRKNFLEIFTSLKGTELLRWRMPWEAKERGKRSKMGRKKREEEKEKGKGDPEEPEEHIGRNLGDLNRFP